VNFKFYFYFWSTLGAFIAVLFLLCLVMRFRKPLAPLSILLFVGVLKALPYIHRFVITGAADRGPNFGYTLSHLPITSPGCWVAIAVIVLGIVFLKKLRDSPADAVLYFAAPVVFLITMNQNVITGKIVQPWHYELFTGAFLLSLSLSLLFNRLNLALRVSEFLKNSAQKKPIFQPLLLLLVLMLFFFSGIILFFYYFKLAPRLTDAMLYIAAGAFEVAIFAVLLQIFVSLLKMPGWDSQRLSALLLACVISLVGMEGITRQAYISALASQRARPVQELASAFEWLNHNTPPGSTVLAAFETAERIPLFTHNTVYLCKNAFHENAGSESQRWNRAINWFILTGHTPTQFRNRLAQWPYGYLFWGVLGLRPRKDLYAFGRQPPVSKDTLQKLLEVYRKKCEIPIESIMREYSLQYIFWGRAERAFFKKDPAILPFVHPVYVNAHTRIYAVKTDQGIENTSLFDN